MASITMPSMTCSMAVLQAFNACSIGSTWQPMALMPAWQIHWQSLVPRIA